MKRDLKGKRFQSVEEVREKMMEALKTITLQEFQNCFEQWKKRWDKCIYFPRTFASKPKIQLLKHMKAMSSTDGFTLWQKLIKYESFRIPKQFSWS